MGGNMSALHRSVETLTCPKQLTAYLNNTMGLKLDDSDTKVLAIALNRNNGKGLSMEQIRSLVDTNESQSSVLAGGDDLLEHYFTKAEQHHHEMSVENVSATEVISSIFHKAEQIPMTGGGAKDFNAVSLFSDTDPLEAGEGEGVSLFSDVDAEVSLFSDVDSTKGKVSLFSDVPPPPPTSKVSLFSETSSVVKGGGGVVHIPTFSVEESPSNSQSKLPQIRVGGSSDSSSSSALSSFSSSARSTDYMSAKSRMRKAIEEKYRV